jgi:uncharacterized repeat protein (TIGR01451 family)
MKRTLLTAVLAMVALTLKPGLMAAEPLSASAIAQIQAIQAEKAARSPAQRKMDSQIIYALKKARKTLPTPAANNLILGVTPDANGMILVDLDAEVTGAVLKHITESGGEIVVSVPRFRSVRARVPLETVEALAAHPDVKFVRPADRAMNNVGRLNSEGDITHNALPARQALGVDGAGIKVGVISDSVDYLANSQASGDLPFVTILTGQSGVPGTGEGTAMLEIVHDIAPGADLFYATAFNGQASFAQNIINLRAAGCDIIVDDVRYFAESPFQDGPIAQAVNQVTADGALYFSSAGNSGNQNDGTSGTWEGDFRDGGAATGGIGGKGGNVHSFGGTNYNVMTSPSIGVMLHWSDPAGKSTNDYDLYILDANGANVLGMSTTVQNGTQDPIEGLFGFVDQGYRIVVVKASAAAPRYLNIDTLRGQLAVSTPGEVKGHAVATNAFCVAAVDVATAFPNPFVGGIANPVESFSSDGPRRIFYHADGSPITPGSLLSTGGVVRLKPDIAAADGVQTTVPGFDRFFGTSAAAPHAAAIAALIKSRNQFLTPLEVRNILTNSALDIEATGNDQDSGMGIVMAAEALRITPPGRGFNLVTTRVVGGNGNETIDPNECNQLFVSLKNIGRTNAVAGQATLSTTTPGVTIVDAIAPFPFTLTNKVATNIGPFQILTSPGFICGVPIDFELVVASGPRRDTNRFQLRTGQILLVPVLRNNNTPVAIPDNNTNGVISTIDVSGLEGAIGKIDVSLHIAHLAPSNLIVDLIGPDGTKVNLAFKRGRPGPGYGTDCVPAAARTTFDDNAQIPISVAVSPFVGSFRPEQALTAFYGKTGSALNGQWRLQVMDVETGDAGTLQCWTLAIHPSVCQDGGGDCRTDVAVSATASPEPASQGFDLTYNVVVTNQALIGAANVRFTNSLPPGVTFVSATATQGSCTFNNGTVSCNLGSISSHGIVGISLVVRPGALGSLSSTFQVSSSNADANPGNNTATVVSTVIEPQPSFVTDGAQLVAESFSPTTGGMESGETVTVALRLRNVGVIASGNLVATLLEGNGVASPNGPQSYGAIAPGASGVANFTFTANANPGSSISAILALQDGVKSLGTVAFAFTLGGEVTVENPNALTINVLGAATPYPSTLGVSGVQNVIGKVRVTFNKLSHSFPDDIDAMLVGPHGQRVVLMSDAGGSAALNNRTFTFDDAAGALPNEATISPGSYHPADYNSGTEPGGDVFPAPAPVGARASSLAAFNGTDPNGTWSLFVHDDAGNDGGSLGAWSLTINTVQPVNPVADLEVTSTVSPAPIAGEPFTITLNVVNHGPSNATSVLLTNVLPIGMESASASSSQGSVLINGGILTGNLGTITNGGSATVSIVLQPSSLGLRTNIATVVAVGNDLNLANNVATTAFNVTYPLGELALRVVAAPSPVFVTSNITFVATISNAGPNHSEAVRFTNRLAAGLTFVSAESSQGSCSFAGGVLTCQLGDMSAGSNAMVTVVATANASGAMANLFAVTSDFADLTPANDSTNVVVTVQPFAPLIVASGSALASETPGSVNGTLDPGETVTISFGLRNAGTAPTANLVATLLPSGGVSPISGAQNYGSLAANGPTTARPFSFVVNGAAGSTLTASLQLQDGAQNLGTVTFNFAVSASRSFTNGNVIIIPNSGQANTYPSTLGVSGIAGSVSKVTVTIRQLTHTFPEDIDMLLVGPAGQKVVLMSDAGAGNPINSVTLTLDDTAGPIPFAATIGSGTYHPTDYMPGDTFPSPAPAGPYGTNLSAFNGSNPNGTWSLYVLDDIEGDAGRIDGGWELNIQTASPVVNSADVAIIASASGSVESGAPFTYSLTVVNYGPAVATGVTLANPLPPTFVASGGTISQGSFNITASNVTANFGTLNVGASAVMTLNGAAVGPRSLTNVFTVAASQPDPNLGNNSATVITSIAAPVLSIRRSGGNAVITWRSPSTGYTLESSLNATGAWSAAGLPVINTGGTNSATTPATGRKFFRLHK